MIDIAHFVKQAESVHACGAHLQEGEKASRRSPLCAEFSETRAALGAINVQHDTAMVHQSNSVLLALRAFNALYFRATRRGMAALEQLITYNDELRAGGPFEIRSSVPKLGAKIVRVRHNVHKPHDGMLSASATTLRVHLDTGARKSLPRAPGARQAALPWIIERERARA